MKPITLIFALALLTGCTTLNDWGIGGKPTLQCAKGKAEINDRIAGSDRVSLAMIRQFDDANALCAPGKPGG